MIDIRIENLGNADLTEDIENFIGSIAEEIPNAFRQLTDESTPRGRLYRKGMIKVRRTKALESLGLRVVSKSRLAGGNKIHRASAPGQMPAIDTKELYNRIRVFKRGKFKKTIRFDAPHAGFVEEIRPFLDQTIIRAIENVTK